MNPLVTAGLAFFAIGFVSSRLLHSLARKIAIDIDMVDTPGPRKLHHETMPLSGGLQIFGSLGLIATLTITLCYLDSNGTLIGIIPEHLRWYAGNVLEILPIGLPIVVSLLLIFITGIIDDFKGARVRSRFLLQGIAACLIIQSGIRPEFFDFPGWVIWPIALFWIVGITNAFNLIDGMNGLCSGVAMISSLLFMTAMALSNQPLISLFYACFIGCLLGFFVLNFPRAKTFLGSAGSLSIGFIISVTVLMSTFNINAARENSSFLPAFMPVIILTMPLYDTLTVMWIRWQRRRPLTEADQNHFAHRLLRLGFTRKQAVIIIFLITFSFGLSALLLVNATHFESLVLITQIFALMGLLMLIERRVDRRENRRGYTHIKATIRLGHGTDLACTVTDASRMGLALKVSADVSEWPIRAMATVHILGDPQPLRGSVVWVRRDTGECGLLLEDSTEFSPALNAIHEY